MKNKFNGILLCLVLLSSGCSQNPKELAHTFDGEASGAGFIFLDRLTHDKTAGIKIFFDLLPSDGGRIDTEQYHTMVENGSITVSLSDEVRNISVKVYEFNPENFDSFYWYHGGHSYHNDPAWVAVSGHMTVYYHPASEAAIHPSASATLSDIVFTSRASRRRRIIKSIEIPKVMIQYIRE